MLIGMGIVGLRIVKRVCVVRLERNPGGKSLK